MRTSTPTEHLPAEWVVGLMKASGKTQAQLAKLLECDQTTVSRLARGLKPLEREDWQRMVELCGKPAGWEPPDWPLSDAVRRGGVIEAARLEAHRSASVPALVRLAGRMTVSDASNAKLTLAPQLWLPLYDLSAMAGGFSLSMSPAVEALLCVEGLRGPIDGNLFVSRVTGKSMAPMLRDGDLVVWRRDDAPQSGDTVLAQRFDDGDEADSGGFTVKRLHVENGRARLVPLNDAFPVIDVPPEPGRVVLLARLVALVDQG